MCIDVCVLTIYRTCLKSCHLSTGLFLDEEVVSHALEVSTISISASEVLWKWVNSFSSLMVTGLSRFYSSFLSVNLVFVVLFALFSSFLAMFEVKDLCKRPYLFYATSSHSLYLASTCSIISSSIS